MNLHAPMAAAIIFCVATGNAAGQTEAYDWGQSASKAAYGQAMSSDSYDWGQSAVNNGYYGRQSSSTSVKRRSIASSLGSVSGENKGYVKPSVSAGTAPQPTNSGFKTVVPGTAR